MQTVDSTNNVENMFGFKSLLRMSLVAQAVLILFGLGLTTLFADPILVGTNLESPVTEVVNFNIQRALLVNFLASSPFQATSIQTVIGTGSNAESFSLEFGMGFNNSSPALGLESFSLPANTIEIITLPNDLTLPSAAYSLGFGSASTDDGPFAVRSSSIISSSFFDLAVEYQTANCVSDNSNSQLVNPAVPLSSYCWSATNGDPTPLSFELLGTAVPEPGVAGMCMLSLASISFMLMRRRSRGRVC